MVTIKDKSDTQLARMGKKVKVKRSQQLATSNRVVSNQCDQ